MPEISSFYGIVIYMYVSEHNPLKGSLPRRALNLVYEWLDLHKQELMENWELLREFKSPKKIKPLE